MSPSKLLSPILDGNKSPTVNVIDKGSVIGEGKHDELLKSSVVFKNFYEKQIKRS